MEKFCLKMKYIWNPSHSNLDILDWWYLGISSWRDLHEILNLNWCTSLIFGRTWLDEVNVLCMWDEHVSLEVRRCLLLRWLRGSMGHIPKLFNALCMNEQFNFGFFRCTSKSLSTTKLAFSLEHVSWQLLSNASIIRIWIG